MYLVLQLLVPPNRTKALQANKNKNQPALEAETMQATTSLLCSSTVPFPTPPPHPLFPPFRLPRTPSPSFPSQLPFNPPSNYLHATLSPLQATAVQETVENAKSGAGFVEVGYISSVHGLHGEICVKPITDFPELRFAQPGRRWLRQSVSGKDIVREVDLVEGRGHPAQKSWILRFLDIETVDQAKQLVGSAILVSEDDRPELEEGEFYSRDLVGMKVILKETGECVGTVVNVFDSGASDLLQVMLYPSVDVPDGTEKSKLAETGASGRLVWVPFVQAIVPHVDMSKREMQITPPKGLLELNLRLDERSKKERRQLEWNERKKFQRRLIAAKKKLCEMQQKHVFDGLRYGEKSQRSLLADQIVSVNSKLLQQALQNLEMPSKRWNVTELINATKNKLIKSSLKISKECLTACASEDKLGAHLQLQEKGHYLLSKGKVAIVLVANGTENGRGNNPDLTDSKISENSLFSFLQNSLSDDQTFLKIEDRASVPLVFVCPVQEIQSLKRLFSDNEYYALDPKKVWFLEEENLPVVNSSEQKGHKILMKSPWEILQSPVGSGGVISSLSTHNLSENLAEMGVEYIEICSPGQKYVAGNPLLLGHVDSQKAEIGVQISEDMGNSEASFDLVFSSNFIKLLTKQMDKLGFHAIPKPNPYVELIDREWIDVVPSSPNSYELQRSIYSSLDVCPLDKICVMEITE